MRVFVTGASGFVGSVIVRDLIGAGHRVVGLARSEAGVDAVTAAGAEARRGDLEDLEGLREAAAGADAVIHTAFIHDFSRFEESCATDGRVIEALGPALAGSDRPLVVTSGTALLPQGRLAEEHVAASDAIPRVASERAADALAARGVRVAVVRLPPSVHDVGDRGFVPMLAAVAREKGVSAYVGEGANRWPAAHRPDAAGVYRLAIGADFAPGTRYHAVAEEGVPFREIAAAIGRLLGVPVAARTVEEASGHFGWMATFAALDNPASGRRTRELLGWEPRGPGLIADIDRPGYLGA